MAFEIKMPQLSDTMHSGKILAWRKSVGDAVSRGDILAEVETDKANLEIEAFNQGVLLAILTPAQDSANVGDVIAYIGQAGEQTPTGSATSSAAVSAAAVSLDSPAAPSTPVVTPSNGDTSARLKASPLARKIAEQQKIDLSSVRGSGPLGRIIKKDLEHAASGGSLRQASPLFASPLAQTPLRDPAPTAGRPSAADGSGRSTPLSKMRETIARRMQQSVAEAPHFYSTISINMREAQRLREVLKHGPEYAGISINHLVIKASAYALAREPRVNFCMRDGQLYEPAAINIGVITALEDGLMIPVVKQVDQLTLRDVVFEARAAIERVRAGRPSSSDLLGGTFSISNMGMFDLENFTAIINPGQGAVLAVSAAKEQPIAENGQIVIAPMMKVTLSVDHRIIDGVMAATFLKHFKQALELPALLMV